MLLPNNIAYTFAHEQVRAQSKWNEMMMMMMMNKKKCISPVADR